MRRRVLGQDLYFPLDPYKTSRRIEVRILRQYLDVRRGDRMCDVGSGYGYWTQRIARDAHCVGVDISWKATRHAQEKHSGRHSAFVLGNVESLPFDNEAFDKIFGVCSIEHVPGNVAAFREIGRCLRPGGVLAMTVDSLNYRLITPEKRARHAEEYYVAHFYDASTITAILERAGFAVTHTRYIICSPLAHRLNSLADRHRKLQYPLFPLSYPLTLVSDRLFGRSDEGWKLAVRAVKQEA